MAGVTSLVCSSMANDVTASGIQDLKKEKIICSGRKVMPIKEKNSEVSNHFNFHIGEGKCRKESYIFFIWLNFLLATKTSIVLS